MPLCRLWTILALPVLLHAQDSPAEFFEKKIRPVLATKCYGCHSSKLKSPMGGLVLDTKAGLHGAAQGKLLSAISFADTRLQMPPTGKLSDLAIGDFERWIAAGAVDPRTDVPVEQAAKPAGPGMPIEKGRSWWAFQPVRELPVPAVKNKAWPQTKIDWFLLAALEAGKLQPSAPAGARTLIRRATIDLSGLKPSYDEIEAFAKDDSPEGYRRLIERLLASPQYGERWGRYWLDVARYAEDNPTTEATNPAYSNAWRYRDWVIEAINADVPFDRFVKLQLAADLMPGEPRDNMRALGYLGSGPVYHKDARLSKEVIETLASDDWDERVDAVSRGLLGLTVACARCHDHKFDPITTKDYYSLAGVFASTAQVERPIRGDIPFEVEQRFLFAQQRLIHVSYLASLLTGEPGTKPEEAAVKVKRFKAEVAALKAEIDGLGAKYPELEQYVARFGDTPKKPVRRGIDAMGPETPFYTAVYDAALYIDGSDPDLTTMDIRPGKPRDLPVFLRGSVSNPGEPAPRRFLTVLSKASDGPFQGGSGRLELAEQIFRNGGPLAARVMVNRVWAWHFGKPLVPTLSDFGTQGERPSHPELLDDLAARFMANGWSLKWLHREIMLSAAYRQSSRPRDDGEQSDPVNKLLWRMNPRRLDIESYRDSILQATGSLSVKMAGQSADLESKTNSRRTVYARVSRGRLNNILRLYDFPDPAQHSPMRDLTTTPLQQLFVLNSPFLQEQAAALAKLAEGEPAGRPRITALYRRALGRDPSPNELDLGYSYLDKAGLAQYAQALLATSELIFWP